VVGDGTPAVVSSALEGLERLLVVSHCLSQSPLDVGQNSKVLLGTSADLCAAPSQLERPAELFSRRLHRSALEVECRQRVQRLCRQDLIADLDGNLIAALAQLAGQNRLATLMLRDPRPAERLRQDLPLLGLLGSIDGGGIALQRLRHATALLVRLPFPQEFSGAVGPYFVGPPR
jgi:hypothetical protein